MSTEHQQAIPVLVRHMYDPGMGESSVKSLIRFGTNALPALAKAAEEEKKGHIRLAEIAIERIERQSKSVRPTP